MLENIQMSVQGDELTIKIDLSVKGRPSKNRRAKQNLVIASSNGTFPIIAEHGGFRPEVVNISVWRQPTEQEAEDYLLWRKPVR